MLRVIAEVGRPVERFLDLGCGQGVIAHALLAGYPQATPVMADLWPEMLDAARDGLGDVASRAAFVEVDFTKPGWSDTLAGDGPYDVIASGFAIHHVPTERKAEFYRQLTGLLAPGGVFVNIEWVASPTAELARASDRFLAEHYHPDGDFPEGRTLEEHLDAVGQRGDRTGGLLVAVETQNQWLREAGLEQVDCYFKCFELAVFGGRKPA